MAADTTTLTEKMRAALRISSTSEKITEEINDCIAACNATMKTGDVIEINTKYGSKGAKLIRDGVETDYFRYIDVDSTFMQLAIGDNMFRYDAASGVNSLEVSIFYSKEFLGV